MAFTLLDDDQPLPRLDRRQTLAFDQRRQALLASLARRARHSFGDSKPHLGPLSPGCLRCAEGAWSCLFLNGVCGADCFFCPGYNRAPQAPPWAERLVFDGPAHYAAYVRKLGFRGVGISGGDPLLALDKLLAFVAALRADDRGRDTPLDIWAYTSGMATRPEGLRALAEAGLDELRFNIAARDYRIEPVREAVGLVPRVVVEIPAVPEDRERLLAALPELARAGVHHLHLHQLMVLGANGPALAERGYTFARDAVSSVVESELLALEVMQIAADAGLELPIQYCGTAYKGRWQNQVDDRRAGPLVARPWESRAETGLLRRLWLAGAPEVLETAERALRGAQAPAELWRRDGERLYLHPQLVPALSATGEVLRLVYLKTLVGEREVAPPAVGPDDGYAEIALGEVGRGGEARSLGVRLLPVCAPIPLDPGALSAALAGQPPAALAPFERVATGLAALC